MQRNRAALLIILTAFVFSMGLAALNTVDSAPSFKQMAAGKLVRSNDTWQGFTTWDETLYFTSFSKFGTGDILDFTGVKLGAGGYVWTRLGLCSDDAATNITLTNLTHYTLTYSWTGAGGATRVWCPDAGMPLTVTNGVLTNWDATYQVATINPTNEFVTLTWTPTTQAASQSYDMLYFAFMLLSLVFGVGIGITMLRSGTPSFEAVMLYVTVVTILYAITQLGLQVISRLS